MRIIVMCLWWALFESLLEAMSAFPDESRVRELAEQIRARCMHAHQLKLAGQQATATGNLQVAQADEIQKRLTETVLRLQEASRDFSLSGLQQRLQLTAQKLSLSFDMQRSQQQATSFFLSCDAFFVEICCHDSGHVTSVKLVQGRNKQQELELFASLLREHKVSEFESHLQSLTELYTLAGPVADKANVFQALTATESVLTAISESSPRSTLCEVIMTNPLGHVTARSGGFPMTLTYFVHPREVLKHPNMNSKEGVGSVPKGVGVAGRVLVEKSPKVFLLSIDPNLFNRQKVNFFPLNQQNGVPLPVTFVLQFNESFPVCATILEKLNKIVQADTPTPLPSGAHIDAMIAKQRAEKEGREPCQDKCRLVCLPSQRHYYNLPPALTTPSSSEPAQSLEVGIMLPSAPFTHPGHLFTIIPLLRKQLVYNTLLASCLGRSMKGVPPDDSCLEYTFELSSTPPDLITVAMDTQHSGKEGRITVEFTITDQHPTRPVVTVRAGLQATPTPQPQMSEVIKRCLSIPVSLHAALRHPSLLGAQAASLLQTYQQELVQFSRALAGGRESGGPGGGGGPEGQKMVVGTKRKWVE